MQDLFVPYEEALALKELGFDEPCFGGYFENLIEEKYLFLFNLQRLDDELAILRQNDDILAPTYLQAFKWFRERHGVISHIHKPKGGVFFHNEHFFINYPHNVDDYHKYNGREEYMPDEFQNSYEEAELACLRKLIEIVKDNNNG